MAPGFLLAVFVLLALACAFVLPPLWKGARRTAVAVALLLPLTVVPLYMLLGTPAALDPARRSADASLEQQIDALVTHLHAHPDDVDGWVVLARTRKDQGRLADAREAFSTALKLSPRQPELMVELAETMSLADPAHRIDDAALKLLNEAHRADAENQRALWFLGIAAWQRKQYADAAASWQPLLALAPPDVQPALRKQIDAARARAGMPPLPPLVSAPAGPALLHVSVDITPALRARLAAGDVLFVFARAPSGPPMPLAVKRLAAKDFPQSIALADSDGPMPTLRLSQQTEVAVLARVSHAGDATAQPGDFESTPVTAKVGAKDTLAITIDHVLP